MLTVAIDRDELRVICMNYIHDTNPELQQVFSIKVYTPCHATFVYEDIVGIISSDADSSHLSILAINMVTNISVKLVAHVGRPIVRFLTLLAFTMANRSISHPTLQCIATWMKAVSI